MVRGSTRAIIRAPTLARRSDRYARAMPAPSTLALFALAALALIAIPGPNMIYVATRQHERGALGGDRSRRSGC